jgi:hypothetical protein
MRVYITCHLFRVIINEIHGKCFYKKKVVNRGLTFCKSFLTYKRKRAPPLLPFIQLISNLCVELYCTLVCIADGHKKRETLINEWFV